jgi:HK97 gp10 family phage protein
VAAPSLYVDDRALLAAIRRLERRVLDRNLQRRVVRAAGKPVREEARRLCPVLSGDLKASIKTRVTSRRKVYTFAAVGARMHHAHLVEFGTDPHYIPLPKSKRRGLNRGVKHPGAKAKPFLRPAFDTKKDEAVRNAREVLRPAVLGAAKG